ncbi:MAG: hypothetical protein IKJ32_06615 [Clostridia bacterium]|nr:hypothetical protein [Clostridia bacterium]
MNEKRKVYGERKNRGREIYEDTTEYGEFVATFDAWMTPEELKRRANHLANLNKERK